MTRNLPVAFLLLLGFLVAFASCGSLNAEGETRTYAERWESFKQQYGKQYPSAEEEARRRAIWETNIKFIEQHNELHTRGARSFKYEDVSPYTDMSHEEIRSTLMMPDMKADSFPRLKDAIPFENITKGMATRVLPASVDWRQKNVLAPIRQQGQCGSCWAFGAVAALESHWLMYSGKTTRLVELSEQELIDCARADGNNGCHGGWPGYAYNYIKRNRGISKRSTYPYEMMDNYCRAKNTADTFGASITGYVETAQQNEAAIQEAVALMGPVAITYYATDQFSYFRGTGVYEEPSYYCPYGQYNHAMVAVGYGTSAQGVPYWIVRNSYGTDFGENGYVKIRRGTMSCAFGYMGGAYPLVK